MASYQDMYCHNPACVSFNRDVPIRYHPQDWNGPSEWIDNPECYYCYSDLQEEPMDIQVFTERLSECLEPYEDLTEAQRQLLIELYKAREKFDKAVRNED